MKQSKIFQADKKYRLYMTMVEPVSMKVQIVDFQYECLYSKDVADLVVDLNFKNLDWSTVQKKQDNRFRPGHAVIMLRILDEKHIIMGDAKGDNMILFIKFVADGDESEANEED